MNDIHDMTEAMKAEFLAAFRAQFGFGEMTATANDDAAAMLKAAAWAWQASRAAVVVQLPGYGQPECDEHSEWHHTRNGTIDACARMIEAQGLKVAP